VAGEGLARTAHSGGTPHSGGQVVLPPSIGMIVPVT
jgi:hypothetical protein